MRTPKAPANMPSLGISSNSRQDSVTSRTPLRSRDPNRIKKVPPRVPKPSSNSPLNTATHESAPTLAPYNHKSGGPLAPAPQWPRANKQDKTSASGPRQPPANKQKSIPTDISPDGDAFLRKANQVLEKRKKGIAYPHVPEADELSLLKVRPAEGWADSTSMQLSAGLVDPDLEQAREIHAVDDYKELSDLVPKSLTPDERSRILTEAGRRADLCKTPEEAQRVKLRYYIEHFYQQPEELLPVEDMEGKTWRINSGDQAIDNAFAYTEQTWKTLLRRTKPKEGGSLLPAPYPILVPAGRFQEQYYWDTYFAIKGLLATGRLPLAQMQVENMLSYVRRYGRVPNGGRDYFLSRSQPPFSFLDGTRSL